MQSNHAPGDRNLSLHPLRPAARVPLCQKVHPVSVQSPVFSQSFNISQSPSRVYMLCGPVLAQRRGSLSSVPIVSRSARGDLCSAPVRWFVGAAAYVMRQVDVEWTAGW
ncbi:hypothetical protein BaRGS_00005387 [Batillaria attramentaria]|uniref:Uncharacterized protein n=1 Tax=Batillaria attramentaria TaxID=370345 RepID=A0ABD0LWC3_9CAEN